MTSGRPKLRKAASIGPARSRTKLFLRAANSAEPSGAHSPTSTPESLKAADEDFEGAAIIRDKIQAIKDLDLGIMPRRAAALRADAADGQAKAGRAGTRPARPEHGRKKRMGGRRT